jgi:hypothetical protein
MGLLIGFEPTTAGATIHNSVPCGINVTTYTPRQPGLCALFFGSTGAVQGWMCQVPRIISGSSEHSYLGYDHVIANHNFRGYVAPNFGIDPFSIPAALFKCRIE